MKIAYKNVAPIAPVFFNFVLWMGLAIVMRIFMMTFFVHGDLIFIDYFPTKLFSSGVLDIYGYIEVNFPADRIWTYYPPLAYYSIAAFQKILGLAGEGFYQWIEQVFIFGIDKWMLSNALSLGFYRYLFLMKVPYLFFDIVTLFFTFFLVDNIGFRQKILRVWVFSPVLLYGVYIFGQFDIIPTFLVVLSLLCVKKERTRFAFFFLGLAVLFKTFSVFLFLPLLVAVSVSRKEIFINTMVFIAPILIVLTPLYFSSNGSVIYALFPRAYVQETTENFWFFIQKLTFVLLYLIVLFYCIRARLKKVRIVAMDLAVSVIMLVYCISFTPVHYFVWVTPFLVVLLCEQKLPRWLYWAQIVSLFFYNLNSPGTTTWLPGPINPGFFLHLPGLPDIMHLLQIKWGVVMLFSRLVFTAICVVISMGLLGVITTVKNKKAREGY